MAIRTNSGISLPHATTHIPGGADDLYAGRGNTSSARMETIPRDVTMGGQSTATGNVYLSYVTAHASFTAQNILCAGSVTVSAAATRIELGLYTVAANGDLTLVASTGDIHAATDATNAGAVYFQTANKAWSAPIALNGVGGAMSSYNIVRGQRYALAFLQTGGTLPTLLGNSAHASLLGLSPKLTGFLGGQTSLPGSISNPGAFGTMAYMAVT